MVERMMNFGATRRPAHCCKMMLLLAALTANAACAETLSDPMRPPVVVAPQADVNSAPTGPILQSVMISPQRRAAIIGGQTVTIGGKFGNARVIKISESEVVLESDGKLQTLSLFPGVEKRQVTFEKQMRPFRDKDRKK